MSSPPPDDAPPLETRERILRAAMEILSRDGFERATIRAIATAANANVAAINYHFRDKERLYCEVIARCHEEAMQSRAIPRLAENPTDPKERLGAFVTWFCWVLFAGGTPSWIGDMMAHEMARPTAALDDIVERMIRPIFVAVSEIVAALLPPSRSRDDLQRHTLSVLGQCLLYKHARSVMTRLNPHLQLEGAELDALAAHITRFSLAGITSFDPHAISRSPKDTP